MKFKFKIQQYQTDAVEQTVNVFAGQPSKSNAQYRRDLGKRKGQITFEEEYVGWRNNDVELQGHQLLANIQQQQAIGNIPKSTKLSLRECAWYTDGRRIEARGASGGRRTHLYHRDGNRYG